MRTLYSRRNALKVGLGSLAGLSIAGLAACDTPTQPISSQTAASLRMFFWGSATRDKLTRETINLYQQSHPNVTISSQYSGNDTYYTKLNAQIAAGNAPDLIQMDMRYIAQYVRKGTLLDLTQDIYNQSIDLSDFDPILLDSSKVNNTIYGIPLGSNYQCMFYNTTLINKAAIGPIPNDMTWEIFAQYAAELSKALGKGTYGTSDASGNYDTFEIWIRQRGKELYTKEGALSFEQTDVADWYNYWSKARQNNACPPMNMQATLDLTGSPTDSSVIKGKTVFSHLFSNQLEAFQAASSAPLALIAYPQGSTPGLFLKASQLLSISASTKYPNQAASFTSFAIKDPGAVKVLGFERGVPGSVASLAILKPKLTITQQTIVNFMNQVAASGLTRAKEVLDPPGAGQIATSLQLIAQEIGLGKTSISGGAAEFYLNAKKATS
jgi:multiple sugar transport system substrate-binding protein